jgi:preprotein translocase subunit SecD
MVLAVVLIGTVLALPNLASDPALHFSSESGSPIQSSTVDAINAQLADVGIVASNTDLTDGAVSLRFNSPDEQRLAADSLASVFPSHVIAFTSEPRLPVWLSRLGLRPISLGLDLTGGVQFIYEVDLSTVTNRLLSNHLVDFQEDLREADISNSGDVIDDRITISVRESEDVAAVRDVITSRARPSPAERVLDISEQSISEAYEFLLTIPDEIVVARQIEAMQQNILTLRNRVNELGLSEPVVVSMGSNRILVQIPGARDPSQVQRILGSTATLEWHLQDTENDAFEAARRNRSPTGSILREQADGTPTLLRRDVIASGEQLIDAAFTYSEGKPVVSIRLNGVGADRMLETTQRNVGRPLGVLLIEETRESVDAGGELEYQPRRTETVIFLGRIDGVFSSDFVLTGLQPTQAQDLAVLLRSGALAAPIFQVGQSTTVSPTLGQDNIRKGRNALIVGFLLVVAFMAAYYRTFGLIANLALLVNLVLMLGLLSLLGASLTLTGMAGIVLTVGMAVDANVLIFERIREELRNGNSPQTSIRLGYEKAFSTIADANITTLIAAMVLFMFGTGPIKGFAVTLSLGIITSMFTAIVGTRAVVDILYGGRPRMDLSIGNFRRPAVKDG